MDRSLIYFTLVFWTMFIIALSPAWVALLTGNKNNLFFVFGFLISVPMWLWSTVKLVDIIDNYLDKHGK